MFRFRMARLMFILICTLWIVLPGVGKSNDEVTIGEPEIDELFAAQYRYYQSQTTGSVSVWNNTEEELRAEASVTIPEYAPKPLIATVSLPPGEETRVPLRIDLNSDKLPDEGEPLTLDAVIEVSVYSETERVCQKRLPARVQLHNLHILPDRPPEAIAMFIDASDQSVSNLANEVAAKQLLDNSEIAQMLFELMQRVNIICIDQTSRSIQYPRELLRTKIGSNYDCALLYAALLESSNVPVAFMMADEYILVLFEQGVRTSEQKQVRDGAWVPLDIRMLKTDFSRAKAAGMKAYESLKQSRKVKLFTLCDAWKRHRPLKFTLSQSRRDIQLGITYVQRGEIDKARQIFSKYFNTDVHAAAQNNLGNIYLRHGKFQQALDRYSEALKADPGDGAIYLNLGITYAITGEEEKSASMFDYGLRELGSYARMCYSLGVTVDGLDHSEVRSLLRGAEERALRDGTRPLGVRARPDSEQLPLYWKKR